MTSMAFDSRNQREQILSLDHYVNCPAKLIKNQYEFQKFGMGRRNHGTVYEDMTEPQGEAVTSFSSKFAGHHEGLYEDETLNHYESLGKIANCLVNELESENSEKLNSLQRKRANLLYDTNQCKARIDGDCDYVNEPPSGSREMFFVWLCKKWLLLYLVVVVSMLFWVMALNIVDDEMAATSGQLGASTSNDPGLAQRLQLLESNLTRLEALEANLTKLRNLESNLETLQSKLTPQQEEIERLKNVTKANEKIIKTLETRLAEERAKSHALNLTVINLTSSQKVLQSTTSLVNTTLKSDVRDLKDQIAKTKTTLNNIESNSALNFTNLVSKIEQEATHRRGNDSALKAEIDLSTLKRQGAITNLTRDLALLSTKASQDNKDLETRINNTINRSFTSLQTADQNTFSQVTAVNQTLRNMIMNISLTPGPQGLRGTAGAGNLSRCYEKKETFDSNTSAPFIANEVPQGYIVTGIFCTATSDARVISIDDIIFSGKPFKRCSYHRDSGGSGNIQLHSYMWVCPKNS